MSTANGHTVMYLLLYKHAELCHSDRNSDTFLTATFQHLNVGFQNFCSQQNTALWYFGLLGPKCHSLQSAARERGPVMHHCLVCACYLWLWLGLYGMSVTQWVTLSFTDTIVSNFSPRPKGRSYTWLICKMWSNPKLCSETKVSNQVSSTFRLSKCKQNIYVMLCLFYSPWLWGGIPSPPFLPPLSSLPSPLEVGPHCDCGAWGSA